MVEKINRIKSDNINNNNNKLSLIDDTIVTHDNINYSKIRHRYKLLCWIFKRLFAPERQIFYLSVVGGQFYYFVCVWRTDWMQLVSLCGVQIFNFVFVSRTYLELYYYIKSCRHQLTASPRLTISGDLIPR